MRWAPWHAADERAQGGRRSRVVLTPRRWRQVAARKFAAAMVARKPGHQGEPEVSRKPSRRESRFDPVEPVVLPRAFFCTDPRVRSAPGFPCALCLRAAPKFMKSSGRGGRENAGACPRAV